ncbi:MAG: hypothetical protein K2R98_01520 [Gemmataceae bacterium]|nr:hypothetical protein [Gemmataceae bacterium]
MSKPAETYRVDDHLVGKDPSVREVYNRVLSVLRDIGPVAEEAKKTSVHLVRTSAPAGVEMRKGYLLLNLKSDHRVTGPRVAKAERVSARRYHFKVKLRRPDEVDTELEGWLRHAYDLSG